jgi:hypothetical protein
MRGIPMTGYFTSTQLSATWMPLRLHRVLRSYCIMFHPSRMLYLHVSLLLEAQFEVLAMLTTQGPETALSASS